jgi:hypothetical protein
VLLPTNGRPWRAADIKEGMLTVFLFTIAIMSVLVAARLFGSPSRAGE